MGTVNTRYKPEDEGRLIEAARHHPEAFAPLYDHYYKPIFLFLHKRFRDKELTADLTQQVFLKAMLNMKNYVNKGFPFSSWLYRIAINEMNMYFRKSKNDVDYEISEKDVQVLAHELDTQTREEELELLLSCVAELPAEHSQLIEMRFFDKLSFKEIGDVLEITEANAKMKIYRILEKLKPVFEEKKKKH